MFRFQLLPCMWTQKPTPPVNLDLCLSLCAVSPLHLQFGNMRQVQAYIGRQAPKLKFSHPGGKTSPYVRLPYKTGHPRELISTLILRQNKRLKHCSNQRKVLSFLLWHLLFIMC